MYDWMPYTILRNFRRDSEDCCFTIWKSGDGDQTSKDLKTGEDGKIVSWISRSESAISGERARARKNCVAMKGIGTAALRFVYDEGYLEMKKSMWLVTNAYLTQVYTCLCVTFKMRADATEEEYIISNWQARGGGAPECPERGIAATSKEIRILGSNQMLIAHDCTEWTTLLVEWGVKNNPLQHGAFILDNSIRGTFKCVAPGEDYIYDKVYIGAKSDATHFFDGCLASVEWYSCGYAHMQSKETTGLSENLKQLLIKDQMMPKLIAVDPRPTKRKRLDDDA